jgi:hypothetical protein
MKIAICLSGQPRNFNVSFDSLKEFYFPKYDCDVFIHTWKDKQYNSQFSDKVVENKSNLHGDYINLFNPKKIMIEDQILFDPQGVKDPTWGCKLDSVMSMFYSIQICNSLRRRYEVENNFKYDFVLRIRTDVRLIRHIPVEEIVSNNIALFDWTQNGTYNERGYSDVFAIGNSDVMTVYSEAFNSIPHYLYGDSTWVFPDSKLRNEYLLRRHIDVNKIPVQRFLHLDQTNPSFGIVR